MPILARLHTSFFSWKLFDLLRRVLQYTYSQVLLRRLQALLLIVLHLLSFPVFMSASGPLVSSHISPQFLASVVQAVRVALAADEALVSGMEPRFHTLLFLQLVNLHSPRRLWGFLLRIWARRPQPSLLPGWVLRPSCHKPQYNHHKVGQLLLSPPCFKHS